MIFKNIRKRLKVFSILSSLALLIPTQTSVNACGWGSDTEELRYMLFNPDLLHDKSWWTFFYNGRLHYLDGSVTSLDDETILTTEWMKEMKASSSESDVRDYLFGGLPDSLLRINPFYKEIQGREAFKKYFTLAKRCEQFSSARSPWEDGKGSDANKDDDFLIADLQNALGSETNPFLKKKYAFQVLRASFYASFGNVFNETYNAYFRDVKEKSVLDWWALHYKSVLTKEPDSANYYHALVFNHASAKRYISRLHFSRENLDATLALAQNDEERADIYVLASAINPGRGLEYLKKVYELAPDHRQLPLLVGREVNKLEDWLGTTKFANASIATDQWGQNPIMENWQSDFEYLSEVIAALQQMPAFAEKNPEFFNLSLANLNLMANNPSEASQYLDKVRSAQPDIVYQQQVLKIVLLTQQKDVHEASVQEEIGQLLASLIDNRAMKFESQKTLYSLSSYLRYVFANKGMVHFAGLFDNLAANKFCYSCRFETFEYSMISYFDRYGSVNDVAKVIDLFDRSSKNKLEEILVLPYSNKNYFYDLLAVKYLRQGDVRSSFSVLNKVPDTFWFSFSNASANLQNDPFLNNEELFGVQTMVTYNKREILEKMLQLEEQATNDRANRSTYYMQLGNAWFNFTQHSWFMISYGLGYGTDENVFNIARSKAMEYYRKALAGEMDKETRAKTVYMIAFLSAAKDKVAAAKLYETFQDTEFYQRKNCLTLSDIASGNF